MSERKVAVVTGGIRGIGFAIAERLAKQGYDIVITNRSVPENISSLESEITKYGVEFQFVENDVSNYGNCEKAVEKIMGKFGKIDVLVNNAGITKDTLFLRMKPEDFEQVIDINLVGTFNVTKHVVPIMSKQRSGRIINITSVVGEVGNAGQANYAASKAGVIGLTKTLAKEFASRNILVNAVAPGFIETRMTEVLSDTVKENISNNVPLKRMGTAEDVANLVNFLAGDESTYITGQIINVDGGMVI